METKWKVGMKVCCRVRQRITYRSKIAKVGKTMIVTEDGRKWLTRSGGVWGGSSPVWDRSPNLEVLTKEKEQESLMPTAIYNAAQKMVELPKVRLDSAKDFEIYLPKLEDVKVLVLEVLRLASEEEKASSRSESEPANKKVLQANCDRCDNGIKTCTCPLKLQK